MYHMNKKQELNAFIKECITTALIGMMDRKAFDNITITELVKEAGVSRVSFYRNFESKKDVLEKYMDILINEWGKDIEEQNDPSYLSESLVRHYYKYKEFYSLLYKHDLSYMIYENLRKATKMDEASNNIERYAKSLVAGSIFGWLDEWFRLGMKETPEEIMKMTEGEDNE